MPFSPSRPASPRQQAADEMRLCFAVAGGCLLAGGVGSLLNLVTKWHTPLPALAVVGGFYGVMGLTRWWKWSRMKSDDVSDSTPGH